MTIQSEDIPKLDTRLDRAIGYFSPKIALKRFVDRQAKMNLAAYKAAETSRLKSNWSLSSREATPDSWELTVLRNRAREANRNDPVASGAADTLNLNIVGTGLKPQARIRADRLGVTEERASELNRQAEDIWKAWSPMADSANRLDFDEIQFLALAKIIEDGESFVIPTWANEKWRPLSRCLEVIESDRLDYARSKELTHSIETGTRGQPKTYYVRKADTREYSKIKAYDSAGRPKMLHLFRQSRPGQLRGVPFFAPVLTYFKDISDYLEAEIVAARVAACLAVFITKSDQIGAAIAMGQGTETGSTARVEGIEPGMVGYLGLGEDIKVVDPKRPGDSFSAFIESMFRIIGVSIGLPYELLIKDFSKTNYSSARAALLEGRRMFTQWRKWLAKKLCQPVWELVLEEAYLRGLFDAKDFYAFKAEYCRSIWIGGGWGWIDPVKEVESSRKAVDYGLSTLAEEAASQGRDWEEILEQQKREQEKAEELGVEVSRSAPQAVAPIEGVEDAEETEEK